VPVITIEPSDIKRGTCPACGGPTGTVNGFAYRDGDAHAIYYLGWCEGAHGERSAFLTLSLGEWGEGTGGEDRLMVGIEVRDEGMRLADKPVLERPAFLGRFVPRDEALELGGLDELWHLADHIVLDDPAANAVLEWIRGERASVS
jgi:hypothetical protein